MKKILITGMAIVAMLFQMACSNHDKTKNEQEEERKTGQAVKRVSVIDIGSPKSGAMFTVGDPIKIDLQIKSTNIEVDSVIVESNQDKVTLNPAELNYTWKTKNLKVGTNQLKVFAYSGGDKIDSYYLKLRFKSDIKPEHYECRIVNTYPHNENDYTQGLFYDNGILYEGTGQRGKSVLKKIDFKTGKLIAELSLPNEYFGEGITAYKDKIIQLTWTSKVGFVYDKKSFKLLTTIEYYTQGWGITSDDKKLIMSDGTQTIHFLDPEYFNETGKIEVYDNNGPVDNINELEYINGLVYANIWQTEEIIAFDPQTGKVLKRMDCSAIVPKQFKNELDNVLNGIAYDKENNRFFITGKRWPKLYEVKFVKK